MQPFWEWKHVIVNNIYYYCILDLSNKKLLKQSPKSRSLQAKYLNFCNSTKSIAVHDLNLDGLFQIFIYIP